LAAGADELRPAAAPAIAACPLLRPAGKNHQNEDCGSIEHVEQGVFFVGICVLTTICSTFFQRYLVE
jgi:hypothetical protein